VRTYRFSVFHILVIATFTLGALLVLAPAVSTSTDLKPEAGIVKSWNSAVDTIEAEDANFRELLDSYKRNPPGRVLLTPDVRAEQKRRRLKLIDSIIQSHQNRISDLRDLRKYEEASQ
jgi:hypothetical protein